MQKELADRFNDNVERYRRILWDLADKSDWEKFRARAGNLFDYVEVVEVSEIERRFFRIFKSVLVVLVAVFIAIVNMDTAANPQLQHMRYSISVLAVAGICFEFYSYMTFRSFMIAKTLYRKKRKDRFIWGIQQDFREMAFSSRQQEKQAA